MQQPTRYKHMYERLPSLLLVLALLGMATGLVAWTSVPLGLLCVYLLLTKPIAVIKNCLYVYPIFWTGLLFWLWMLCNMLWHAKVDMEWQHVIRNSAWVGLPFCFALLRLGDEEIKKIVYCFTVALTVVSLFCFAIQIMQVFNGAPAEALFYHALLAPFELHAVFFSVYILFCLLFWVHTFDNSALTKAQQKILQASCIWLVLCVLLLSSKLCIALLLFITIWFVVRRWQVARHTKVIAFLSLAVGITLTLLTSNPVQKRFADIQLNVRETWQRTSFTSKDYLDGLSFRLLQWRWVTKSLHEEDAWFAGVGAASSQTVLNKQYQHAGLYMGDGTTSKQGYAAFNTHNSFLQVLLEGGVVGLCIFFTYLILLCRSAMLQRNTIASSFLIIVFAFCFTDVLPGTQAGLMVLLLLPQLLPGRNQWAMQAG